MGRRRIGDWLSVADVVGLLRSRFPVAPHPATVGRWCSIGVNGLVLASRKSGGRRWIHRNDLERFLSALDQPKKETVT